MRTLSATLVLASVMLFAPIKAHSQQKPRGGDYDGCKEQFYDPSDEPCGGGHQHTAGKRDEASLDLSRHRHRYLEDQISQLKEKVAALSKEVEQLKKAGAK